MSREKLWRSCTECGAIVCPNDTLEQNGSAPEVVDLSKVVTTMHARTSLGHGLEPVAEHAEHGGSHSEHFGFPAGGNGDSAAGMGDAARYREHDIPRSPKWGDEAQYVSYEDGTTYIGQLLNGRRHGQGMWKGKNCQYEGQWSNDQKHGKGCQTWNDGRMYDGQFRYQKFDGRGRMVWQTSKGMQTYDGQYKNDLKHGSGKFVWADGRIYDGQWAEGRREGRGFYINSKGEKKVGMWTNDKFADPHSDSRSEANKSEASSKAPYHEHSAIPRSRLYTDAAKRAI